MPSSSRVQLRRLEACELIAASPPTSRPAPVQGAGERAYAEAGSAEAVVSVGAPKCGCSSAKRLWTSCTAIAPAPTAEATRLTEAWRTSPAASTPGMLVSSDSGGRSSGQSRAIHIGAGEQEPVRVSRDLRGQPVDVRAGTDQHEQRVGGDRLFLTAAVAQDQLLEVTVAASADHGGARAHLHVRRRLDRLHQVVRHPGPQRRSAQDERDAVRVAREMQGRLTGGVSAAGDERLLALQRRGLGGRATVEDARAAQALQRGNVQAAVGRTRCENHRSRGDAPPALDRESQPISRASQGGHSMHEQEARAEGDRLLVGLLGETAAADAHREAEVIADQRARPDLSADAAFVHHEDAQPLRGAVDGRRQPRGPGAHDDHVEVVLLDHGATS